MCVIEILTNAYISKFNFQLSKMANTSRKSKSRKSSPIWSFFSVAEDTKYAVCDSCKEQVSQGGANTNDYCFISCYFISFKNKSNRYNLNVKYRIGYQYRQISVIKNRNIRISVLSHIGASLVLYRGIGVTV